MNQDGNARWWNPGGGPGRRRRSLALGLAVATLAALATALGGVGHAYDPTFAFDMAPYSVVEGDPAGLAVITVRRTDGLGGGASVDFFTVPGTATATPGGNQDYQAVPRTTLFFGEGVELRTVNIPIIDDTRDEPDETVGLVLEPPFASLSVDAPSAPPAPTAPSTSGGEDGAETTTAPQRISELTTTSWSGPPPIPRTTSTLTIVDDDPPPGHQNGSNGSHGSSGPKKVGSDSASCRSGRSCTATLVGRNESFEITGEAGAKAKLKAKLNGGDKPFCPGGGTASKEWAEFFFSEGGGDRDKTVVMFVRNLKGDDSQRDLDDQKVCFGAPYRFQPDDGTSLRRDGHGEFVGFLPDCWDLDGGFQYGEPPSDPCILDRDMERKYGQKVFEITIAIPANDLDPRVQRES